MQLCQSTSAIEMQSSMRLDEIRYYKTQSRSTYLRSVIYSPFSLIKHTGLIDQLIFTVETM